MHIRRALLLFAIVLGMAALVASFSRPPDERKAKQANEEPGPATAAPAPADNPPRAISFDAGARDKRRVPPGQAATLEIAVDEAGTVDVPDMGLTASADEHTPARFEVFPTRAGAYAILFRPANSNQSRRAGTLVVTATE